PALQSGRRQEHSTRLLQRPLCGALRRLDAAGHARRARGANKVGSRFDLLAVQDEDRRCQRNREAVRKRPLAWRAHWLAEREAVGAVRRVAMLGVAWGALGRRLRTEPGKVATLPTRIATRG